MRMRSISLWLPLVAAFFLLTQPATAVIIDWVPVGDPGNDPDTEVMVTDGTTGYGSVAYTYLIGKYEVTNAQYAEFLNNVAETDTYGLYNTNMGSDYYGGITRSGSPGSYTYTAIPNRRKMPVNFVSFYDALRFANWLHNGQYSGDTETGAYTITVDGITNNSITRNADAIIFLTNEDEWYKAAYFDGADYFDYPFADGYNGAECEAPIATTTPSTYSHSANCDGAVGYFTDVGRYTGSASPNGTFDQAGNVSEWNEAIIGSDRGSRGSFFGYPAIHLAASRRHLSNPRSELYYRGFRVAAVPEPDAWLLGVTALLVVAGLRRIRA